MIKKILETIAHHEFLSIVFVYTIIAFVTTLMIITLSIFGVV